MQQPRKTAAFKTLGCKLNQYESEGMREALEGAGYRAVAFEDHADVYLVNTCTVTGKSDRDARRLVRQAIRRNPTAQVVVAGCYSQRNPQVFSDIPGVTLVIGNEEKGRLLELLGDHSRAQPVVAVGDIQKTNVMSPMPVARFAAHTRAFLKIQEGCDRRCAYCAVPLARGPNRSLPLAQVVSQAQALARYHREIVLVGVHLGTYGLDLSPRTSLAEGLQALLQVPDIGRIRLSSIEPMEVAEELIDVLASSPRICNHMHLPLQSGDDAVLRLMRRPYTSDDYAHLVRTLVDRIPGLNVGADVMVGFPGESEAAFQRTAALVSELPLGYLHVFSYSPRPGTEAAQMKQTVSEEEKKRRSKTLLAISRKKQQSFAERMMGTVQEVLVEGDRDKATGLVTGITGNYLRVLVDGSHRPGSLIAARIGESALLKGTR